VEQGTREHELVRFRREEIAALDRFPSARRPPHRLCRSRMRRLRRALLRSFLALAALVIVASCLLYLVGVDAIGNERLRRQAEQAIEQIAGVDVDVTLGRLRLVPGRTSLFALEIGDVLIARADDGTPIARAGTLHFGLRAIPLLNGRVELARVAMAEAAFSPSGLPAGGGLAALLAAGEVIHPDTLQRAVFDSVHRAFAMTRNVGLTRVSLTDISLLPDDGDEPHLRIEELELERSDEAEITFEGSALYRDRAVVFDGQAQRSADGESIEHLAFNLAAPETDDSASKAGTGLIRALGAFELALTGRETGSEDRGRLELEVRLANTLVGFDRDEILVNSAVARLASNEGDEAFSVPELMLSIGRTRINLEGRITPTEPAESAGPAIYSIDLVSRRSLIAPADSPEPALPFTMRIAGRFEPLARRMVAERIDMRTAGGEVTASAALTMPAGMAPGVTLALYVADLPTAHAKQFWPWFAAAGARRWTLENVFGGRVRESSLRLIVPPGRLGNGVPLSAEEVYGRFNLSGTRFDIAGRLPPVRNGEGSVAFRGTDVRVELESGTIYMPSGRRVDASGGTLTIHSAHLKPRIGKLSIDVSGEASAIVELASYEPIDASRFHDLAPDDISGDMSGHINADIPLQNGIPASNLGWKVDLRYTDLSLSRPIEGQKIDAASGSLLIQPDRAEIVAEAELNGVPASLRLLQPLGGSSVERVRHVELKMNDAARDRLFPGLGMLVSGPFTVIYDELPGERTNITVQLDRARLTVPWIGWRKGPGIPASASFKMDADGGTVELSDFSLRGESFAVSGLVRLSGGQLEEARLDHVRFNRGDDYAAMIRRDGVGYAVLVEGASIDARGIIKRALEEDSGSSSSGSPKGQAGSVRVDATLGQAYGFNGESLAQVKLSYASGGDRPDRLSVSGAADRYGSITLTKSVEGDRHVVRASSDNAGAVLRFLDIYKYMEGGQLSLALEGASDSDVLSGRIDIRDFWLVNEPRMSSLVAATPDASGRVDATRVEFERAGAFLTKGRGSLAIANGVLRGPLIGSTFQGTLYDANDSMDITGTFMPIYGVNRIFGEIPLIGQILGNGPDGGLIGITYRLSGKFGDPKLQVNPISAIAPGFLRELFEFR